MAENQIDRKELKKPDAFVEKGSEVLGLIEKNKKILAILLTLVVIVIAGNYFYRSMLNDKEQKESSDLYMASTPISEGFEKLTADEKKDPSILEKKFKKEVEAIETIIKNAKSSSVSYEGSMLLANLNYELKNFTQALGYFETAEKKAASLELSLSAGLLKAATLENLNKTDDAIAGYSKILQKNPQKVQKSQVYLGLARNFEVKGEKAKAIEQLDKYLKEFSDAADIKSVESYKARLSTK